MVIKQSQIHDYDLVIVGAGIVGTTLASALKNSGLSIAIVDAQTKEKAASRRQAYALSILSGRIFEGIGVWEQIKPHLGKFSQIRLSDADYRKCVTFQVEDLGTEFLGYVGEHPLILSSLQDYLQLHCQNVTWFCPAQIKSVTYQETCATVCLDCDDQKLTLQTPLVVAADGARSQIRSQAEIKTHGWKYWQSCVTFTVTHQAPRNDRAFERFWPTGPMGILPLTDNRCQIVWTAPHAQAQALQTLPVEAFLEKLQAHTGELLGKLELSSDRLLFPVQLMQCHTYIKPRLALVGDAAHCCHPVGGQGLNLGIRDAAALAQILQEATAEAQDIGSLDTLKAYDHWRRTENLAILGLTDFLDRLFSNNWLPVVVLRRLGLGMLVHLPPLKRLVLQLMTGLLGKAPQLAQR